MAMRTTTDVIEAARMGEPCTEEELRLAIVSMRSSMILAHTRHARWAADESLPLKVRICAEALWEGVNTGWNVPLDQRVAKHDRPGHPSLRGRAETADRVMAAARRGSQRR